MKKALITGGSDGIGLATARLLAQEGYQITLVARNEEKLTRALKDLPGREHAGLTADLSKKEGVDAIALHIAQDRYDLLVNCAGVGMYGRFEELPLADQIAMMQLNMIGLTVLCRSFLQKARQGDSVVNVSSTLAVSAFPGLAVYSATKAYVLNLSESLWWENKKRGIYVLGFCPGVTTTNFHTASGGSNRMFPRFITQTPEAVARALVMALKKRRKPRAVSGVVNRSLLFFQRLLSRKATLNQMGSFSPLSK